MIKKICKISVIALFIINLIPALTAPTFAEDDLFSPLDNIKDELTDDEGGGKIINVIDFSEEKPWGILKNKALEVAEGTELHNLKELGQAVDKKIREKQEANESITYLEALEDIIEDITGPADEKILLEIHQAIQTFGESQIYSVGLIVVQVLSYLLAGIAIIWIIVSGILMVMSQGEESVITEQRRSITFAIVGLVAVLLIERMISIIYGHPATPYSITVDSSPITNDAFREQFSAEILGLVSFAKSIIGTFAVAMIIVSGMHTIFAAGEEEKITKQRKSIIWIVVGLMIILVDQVIIKNIFMSPLDERILSSSNSADEVIKIENVNNIIDAIGTVVQFALGFVGVIALAVLIYGAGLMIANYGNDELIEKAKKMIKTALVGIVIIISAFAIVSTVILWQ